MATSRESIQLIASSFCIQILKLGTTFPPSDRVYFGEYIEFNKDKFNLMKDQFCCNESPGRGKVSK